MEEARLIAVLKLQINKYKKVPLLTRTLYLCVSRKNIKAKK